MKEEKGIAAARAALVLIGLGALGAAAMGGHLPAGALRALLAAAGLGAAALALGWGWLQKRQLARLAGGICETVDALMEGRQPENFMPYEESELSKVQGKLLQYYEKMQDGQRQSQQDKETIQALVSDISHQVKTPVANLKMFTGILQEHQLPEEKRAEFLAVMAAQADKLDFLMQSLVKMSRLETGTFALHLQEGRLCDTIAQAMGGVWAKAEKKGIALEADCAPGITVKHDPKWTAEALANLLDNAVKYTPPGGSVRVSVRPWQFYTRVDIADTGIGIAEAHYSDVFQRFYRGAEVAAQEGVGLGLYLARGIITRQKGYITVKSKPGEGSTFSVYLLS